MPPLKGAKRGRPRKFPEVSDAEPGAKWQKLSDGRSGSGVGDAEQGGGAWADSPARAGGRAPPANGRKSRAAPHAATAAAAAAVIAQQSGAKRPPGRPRKHPLPVAAATTPASPSPADDSPWNQLHLLAQQSSGDEDSPQVGASRESSHGTPAGAGPLLRREDSFAGTASGDLAGRGVGVGDARRRSRKASAPRRQVRRFQMSSCPFCSCGSSAIALRTIEQRTVTRKSVMCHCILQMCSCTWRWCTISSASCDYFMVHAIQLTSSLLCLQGCC